MSLSSDPFRWPGLEEHGFIDWLFVTALGQRLPEHWREWTAEAFRDIQVQAYQWPLGALLWEGCGCVCNCARCTTLVMRTLRFDSERPFIVPTLVPVVNIYPLLVMIIVASMLTLQQTNRFANSSLNYWYIAFNPLLLSLLPSIINTHTHIYIYICLVPSIIN